MSSCVFGNQSVSVQQLGSPEGINIASGSPSLVPVKGALAWDPTTISGGSLYIGTGTTWDNVAGGGGITGISTSVPVTLTSAGQPSINGTLILQKLTIGIISMVYFQLQMNEVVTNTATSTWTQSAIIPVAYRPSQDSSFNNIIENSGTVSTGSSYLIIDTTGALFLGVGSISTFVLISVSGNYSS